MYWMALSCVSIGIVMSTVGEDVGTGRSGITRPASTTGAAEDAGDAEPAPGSADGAVGQGEPASISERGPLLSQPVAPAARRRTRSPRICWILIRLGAVRKLVVA